MKTFITVVIALFVGLVLLTAGSTGNGELIIGNSPMLDEAATDGLAGTEHSLAYRIHEIESHFHNRERWFGISADQSGNDWALDTLNPYVAISGANAYGADANDEAKVFGTDDTPAISGMTKFDIHRILIIDVDHDTVYKLRVVYGSDTMANNITAGQYSEVMVQFDSANPQQSAGVPVEVIMERSTCGTDKVWVQAWNANNNSEIDFLVGTHEYEG
jgi:hypothetical protein